MAVTASISLAAITASAVICVMRVVLIGGIGVIDETTAIATVSFLLLASATAATSSVRGMRAVKPGSAAGGWWG